MTRWLDWVRRLQAVAQNGLLYTDSAFERERWEEVRAIAAELAAVGGDEPEAVLATFAAEAGHATPKLDVRAAAFRDGKVLLVRGRDDGRWTLPGGWVEVGESPRGAAEKELREESGYTGRAVKLVGLYDQDLRGRPRWPFHGWKVYFLCELEPGEPGPVDDREITEVGFFGEDALPELSERTLLAHLQDIFAHTREPGRPPGFD